MSDESMKYVDYYFSLGFTECGTTVKLSTVRLMPQGSQQ